MVSGYFVKGLADALDKRDENILIQKKLDLEEETLRRRNKEEFLDYFSKISKTPKSSSMKSKSRITDDQIQFLQNQGYSDDFLSKVIATENPTVFQTLLSGTNKALTSLKKTQPVEKLPEYMIDSIERSATFSDPTEFEIDIDKMAEEFGIVITEAEREMLRESLIVPGSATFSDATFTLTEKPSLENLDMIEKRALNENLTRAKSDLKSIIDQLGAMNELTDPISTATKSWLSQKKVEIETAIENYKKDDIFDLAGLYGMSYMKKLIDYYPNFVDAPINPAVLNASKKIITVPNGQVANQLGEFGLLREGEIVLNQQTGRPLPIGFDVEYWNSEIGQDLLKKFIEQM